MIDRFSRWPKAILIPDQTAQAVANAFYPNWRDPIWSFRDRDIRSATTARRHRLCIKAWQLARTFLFKSMLSDSRWSNHTQDRSVLFDDYPWSCSKWRWTGNTSTFQQKEEEIEPTQDISSSSPLPATKQSSPVSMSTAAILPASEPTSSASKSLKNQHHVTLQLVPKVVLIPFR